MSNWLEELGISTESYEEAKPAKVASGFMWEPGAYLVVICEAFVRKTDNSAKMLEIKFQDKDGNELRHSVNTMYVDKKTGDDTENKGGTRFLKMLMDSTKTKDPKVKIGTVKFGDKDIQALGLTALIGKKVTICVTQKESDYNADYPVINDVYLVLDEAGRNVDGEDQLEAFAEKIEKTPIIPLRKKKEQPKQEATESAPAGSGW